VRCPVEQVVGGHPGRRSDHPSASMESCHCCHCDCGCVLGGYLADEASGRPVIVGLIAVATFGATFGALYIAVLLHVLRDDAEHEQHWTSQVFQYEPGYAGAEFDLWSNCDHELVSARPDVVEPGGRRVKGQTIELPQHSVNRGQASAAGATQRTSRMRPLLSSAVRTPLSGRHNQLTRPTRSRLLDKNSDSLSRIRGWLAREHFDHHSFLADSIPSMSAVRVESSGNDAKSAPNADSNQRRTIARERRGALGLACVMTESLTTVVSVSPQPQWGGAARGW
jgi:hypothetical protein